VLERVDEFGRFSDAGQLFREQGRMILVFRNHTGSDTRPFAI